MDHDISHTRRDLVTRVATLELLVSDLIDILWRVDPRAMEQMARDAAHDLEIQTSRIGPPAVEARRERLYAVLTERGRKLSHRRSPRRDDSGRLELSIEARR